MTNGGQYKSYAAEPDLLFVRVNGYYNNIYELCDRYFYFAYLPELDSAVLIDNNPSPESTYNFLVDNSTDLQNINPICASLLLLNILNDGATAFLIESVEDLYISDGIKWFRMNRPVPPDWPKRVIAPHYFFHQDLENIIQIYPSLEEHINDYRRATNNIGGQDIYKDLSFYSPQIIEHGENNIIKLMVYIENYDTKILLDCEVTLSKDNHLLSIKEIPLLN